MPFPTNMTANDGGHINGPGGHNAIHAFLNTVEQQLPSKVDSTDPRLTNERTPANGSVTYDKLASGLVGTSANTLAAGNDSRLSNERVPSAQSVTFEKLAPGIVGSGPNTLAAGNDARLTNDRTPTDNSVGTPKIVDAAVTKPKLASAVQTSLDKADSALQPSGNLAGLANKVTARANLGIVQITESAYAALTPKDANTLYIVTAG